VPRVSVVIPLGNEPAEIGEAIVRWWRPEEAELLVAASGESPAARVLRDAGARVLLEPGATRGARLRTAAELAQGGVLLFLHADSRPPEHALELVRRSLDSGAAAGSFRLAYENAGRALRWTAWWANVRSRLLRLPFGDQGLFCSREAYAKAGGFRDLPVCDDVDLVRRLRRIGPFAVLPERVVTSARHYRRRGAARQTFRVWTTLVGYFMGVDAKRLARWYFRD
jgi:rSAM/selenodomain-associated transferase 2